MMKMNKAEKATSINTKPIQVRQGNTPQDILKEATDRAVVGYEYHRANMDRAEQNLQFIFGEHYSVEELKEKELDNRIALTFNKLPQFINKVTGSQRSTVQTIKASPTGASIGQEEPKMKTGQGKEVPLSDIYTDLIRDIEYTSNATAWYKMAFKHALEGGFGWLRVLTAYQQDGFDLDILIKGQRDRWSVIPDNRAVEQDMSDMNWCFVTEKMSRKEFDVRYPGKSCEAMPGSDVERHGTFWGDEETVTIAEYFRREPYNKKIVLMTDGKTYDYDDVKDLLEIMAEDENVIEKERTIKSYKVIWCKISQGDILEKEVEFPTSTIPMVPMLGRELDFRGVRRTKGLIDDGIDAQIALNKMRSSAIERIDMSPLSPWIATDKAIEGYEDQWAEANSIKFSTLVYRKGEERPQRQEGSTMPVAELQTASTLDEDMKASIGIFNASLGQKSNEISGKAINARKEEADTGTYEFLDNYQNAIRRIGLLCIEMIPKVYDTERIVRLRGADGQSDTIKLNEVVMGNDGEEVVINDLDHGQHTVIISAGKSYETKQDENADQILDLMKVNPKVAEVGSDLLVKNLDFGDSDVLAERLERTIPQQFLSKDKQAELAKDAPEPTPSPEQIQAQAKQQEQQMDMDMKKMEMDGKIQLENIKLEIAKVNLQIKREELANKQGEEERTMKKEEHDRKQEVAKGIVSQMKPKKKESA